METLTLSLPTDVYQRLATIGSIEVDDPGGKALRDAGLITELAPELRELADPSVSLEEVIGILDRAGGKPLSEMVLEQRRWKQW